MVRSFLLIFHNQAWPKADFLKSLDDFLLWCISALVVAVLDVPVMAVVTEPREHFSFPAFGQVLVPPHFGGVVFERGLILTLRVVLLIQHRIVLQPFLDFAELLEGIGDRAALAENPD
jgi:hypothetical protein